MRRYGLLASVFLIAGSNLVAAEAVLPVVGRAVHEFSLKDSRGKSYSLNDYKSSPLVVLAVLGTECPLAKQYAIKLQKLADEYAEKGVAVLAVDANRQDSLAEIAAFAKTNSIEYPILKDLNQQVVESLTATRTPEVFLLDANRVVRYRGRVDDQYAVGGKSRKEPTREDLKSAIDELLEQKPVSVPETQAIGCLIGKAREPKNDSTITYSNQISRLMQKHCVECHRPGEIAPFTLTDYQEVAGWADMMVEVTQSRQMPPWHATPEHGHFSNDRSMTAEEIELIKKWAEAGAPEGNRSELPEPVQFTEGWQLPRQPDQVVWMSEKPYEVPADGVVKYQYFQVDPGFTEDKWVTAAEIIPGNRAVVHHVIVFMHTDGKVMDEEQQMLKAYVPGLRSTELPKGMAKKVPKGAKFVFQMHYTPNGTATEDRTQIGLCFANPDEITHSVRTAVLINRRFKIEPELDNQAFETRTFTVPVEMQLLSLSPHMHLRGKSFHYELTTPDGKTETLLDVPHYDFNWQTSYFLTEPLILAKGTKLNGFGAFDNSRGNLANPDPTATVTWGEQSWDEMLLGYFDIAIDRTKEAEAIAAAANTPEAKAQFKRIFNTFDKNKDGKITRDEIQPLQIPIFEKLDADKDDVVTEEEVKAGLPELMKLLRPQP